MIRSAPGEASRWRLSRRAEERLVGYAFLLPDLLGLAIFVALPILGGVWVSLHDWSGLGEAVFIGLDNYLELLSDTLFLDSLRITVTYVVLFVPLLYVIALGLALLVNQRLKLSGFFRSAYFMPVMVSLVVASVIWSFIFQERAGVLNAILGRVGLEPQPWLGSTQLALISVVIVSLWQGVGYSMIIFLAGLQDIPGEFYDAAKVDGANAWQRFWRITLPLLKPTSVFVVITSFIGSFQVFDPVYVLTSGGPAGATSATVYYIYENAFEFLRIGYASALAVALFAIIFIFTMLQLRWFRHESHY
jgi:multiple sugar transport system permease protein